MNDKDLVLNVSDSSFVLDGDLKLQAEVSKDIATKLTALESDQTERQNLYTKRLNFYQGKQHNYTNIYGKTKKERKGHANAVANYAGKTAIKISYSLANNPPKFTLPVIISAEDKVLERSRADHVQQFIDGVLSNKINRFWKKTWRRAAFNQVVVGDAAVKTYPRFDTKEIKIVNHEDMGQILVGWRGDDPSEFDFVITKCRRTAQSIKDEFGFEVPKELVTKTSNQKTSSGNWTGTDVYSTKNNSTNSTFPSGKNTLPGVDLIEYDDESYYALKINDKLVQLLVKDDVNVPKIKFWTIIPNIPNPPKPWSLSDIDFLMEPQVELNETDNDARDYIRTGATQRFVAYNMANFDPERLNSASGQVIFVDSTDGTSRFEALQTNVNNFPADSFSNRKLNQLYDMGLPKVAYGSSSADSGRSKAIDFQSAVDLTQFKRDAWELALQDIFEKIQVLGHFMYPELDIFSDETDEFIIRDAEFDWVDILPLTQSDKIVNVINKLSAGLPFREFYKELGYRDVDSIIEAMREEAKDPDLMVIRSKMWQLTAALVQATQMASVAGQGMEPNPNQAGPTLNVSQNGEGAMPMAQEGGTTAFSTLGGNIRREAQNAAAQGG